MDPKNCLWCRWFQFDTGYPALSEITPGLEPAISCTKGHWPEKPYGPPVYGEEGLRERMLIAGSCEEYDPIHHPYRGAEGGE